MAFLLVSALPVLAVPLCTLTDPGSSGEYLTGNYQLEASASETTGGNSIVEVEYWVDGVNQGSGFPPAPFAFNLLTGFFSDGGHSVAARSKNNLGTFSSFSTRIITIDNSVPDFVSMTQPTSAQQPIKGTINMTATAFDSQSLIDEVIFYVDGSEVGRDSNAPYGISLDTSTLPDGFRNYQVEAVNNAGLSVVTAATSFMTDNSPPVIGLVQPNTDPLTGLVAMQVVGNDPETGITLVEFLVDGVVRGSATGSSPFNFNFDSAGAGVTQATMVFQARARNGANLVSALEPTPGLSFRVDNTPPTVSITAPANGALVRGPITVSANAADTGSDIGQVQLFVDGALQVPTLFGPTGPFDFPLNTGAFADGFHTLRVDATNGVGMLTQSFVIGISIDNTAPTATLTAPAPTPVAVTGSFLAQASANDPGGGASGIANVQFLVDGVPMGAPDTSAPYQTFLSGLGDGPHILSARATDNAGNQFTDSYGIIYDNSPPSLSGILPVFGSYQTGAISLQANASENASQVAVVRFLIDGVLQGADVSNPYSVAFATGSVADGPHTYRVEALNTTTPSPLTTFQQGTLNIDNSNPGVTQTAPPATPNRVKGSITIAATVNEPHSGVSQLEWLVDGAVNPAAPPLIFGTPSFTTSFSTSFPTTVLADGAHTFSVRVTNGVGLITTTGGVGLTVDNTAPTPTLLFPDGTGFLQGSTFLFANASDPSPITLVEFLVDGTPVASTGAGGPFYLISPFDSATLANGNRQFSVRATDGVGNVGTSGVTVQPVDNGAPTVTFVAPSGTFLSGQPGPVDLVASATDVGPSGMQQVEFFVGPSGGALASQGIILGLGPTFTRPAFDPLTLAPDGLYDFQYVGTDSAGNTGQVTRTLTVDNTSPTLAYVGPTAGFQRGTIQMSATASDATAGLQVVRFFIDNVQVGAAGGAGPNFTVNANTLPIQQGVAVEFRAEALDLAGNQTVDIGPFLVIDNTAPTVSLLNPLAGAFITGPAVSVSATANDPGVGIVSDINRVEFSIDGGVFTTDSAGPPWSGTLDTTAFGPGTHQLRARAVDNAGNATFSLIRNVIIDNSPPAVFQTNPGGGSPITGSLSLFASANDFESGVPNVDFFVDLGYIGSSPGLPYTTPYDTTVLADGPHDFHAVATNGAGLSSMSATVTVTVDNSAPVVGLTTPGAFAFLTGVTPFAATAVDPHTSVVDVSFLVDGIVRGQDLTPPYTFSFSTGQVTDGPHVVTARATNQVGLSAVSTPGTSVVVDNSVPVVQITTPTIGFQTGIYNFDAFATDPHSGILQVEFYVDGSLQNTDLTSPYSTPFNSGSVTDGSHSYTAVAINGAGLRTVSTTFNLISDNSAPLVAWTSPAAGAAIADFATLLATASDPHTGIASVEFLVDGVVQGNDLAAPYALVLDTTLFPDGPHNFQARAFNNVLLSAISSPVVTLTIDNSAPATAILTPQVGAFAGLLTVDATAVDADSGIASVELFVDGSPFTPIDLVAPYSFAVDTTVFTAATGDGSYTLEVLATNGAGLTTLSTPATVIFDNSVPSVSLTSPTGPFLTGLFQYQALADDFDSGIARVEFTVDGTTVATATVPVTAGYVAPFDSALILPDGPHDLGAFAVNGAGLASPIDAVQVIVDNSAPAVTLTSPSAGPLRGSIPFGGTATDPHSGITEVELWVDGSSVVVLPSPGTPYAGVFDTTTLADGPHDFQALARNGAGLTTLTSPPVNLLVDNTLPLVTLGEPVGGGVTATFAVTGTASDAASGVATVTITVDGVPRAGAPGPGPNYGFVLDSVLIPIPDGPHDIRLVAVDVAGNLADTGFNQVYVDNTPPTVTLDQPALGAFLAGDFLLQATASDPHSPIVSVEFLVDAGVVGFDASSPYSLLFATTLVADGPHDFQARAINIAGLSTLTPIRTVVVDNSAPAVTLTSPTAPAFLRASFPATATATDIDSGIVRVDFLIDTVVRGSTTVFPYQVNLNTVALGLTDGPHDFQALAENGSGLQTITATETVVIDNSVPNLVQTTPVSGPHTGILALGALADDPHSGVTLVEFLVDGSVMATDATSPYAATTDTTTLPDGVRNFQTRATNGAGGVALTGVTAITVDNSPPLVAISSPATTGASGTISFTGTASDAHTGIVSIQLVIDSLVVASGSSSPLSVLTDTNLLADGPHLFEVFASNGVGLTAGATATIQVDNSPPTVSLVNPPPTSATVVVLPVMPVPRQQAAAGALSGSVYVAGGEDGFGVIVATLEEFQPGGPTWVSPLNPMGTARAGAFSGAIGSLFYVAGGRIAPGSQVGSFESFDPGTGNWTAGGSTMATAREQGASAVVEGRLYTFGGYQGLATISGAVEVLDPVAGTWTTLPSMPTPRAEAAAVVWENRIYVVGGETGAGAVGTVEVFDTGTQTWLPGPFAAMPTPDEGHQAVLEGRTLLTLAGSAGVIQAYDVPLNSWSAVGAMPAPVVEDAAGAVSGGLLHLFGGDDAGSVDASTRSFDFERFRLVTGTLTLQANAADPHTGVALVRYLVDGAPAAATTTPPFDVPGFSTGAFLDGFHSFRVEAVNGGGVTGSSPATSFFVQNSAPTATLTFPLVGSGAQSGVVTMTGTGSDLVRVTQLEFLIDGTVYGTDPAAPFASPIDTVTALPALADGPHTFESRATNAVGLQGTSPPVVLVIDNSVPTVTITSPTPAAMEAGTVAFAGTAGDVHSGIEHIEYWIGAIQVGTTSLALPFPVATAASLIFDTQSGAPPVPDGTYDFEIRAFNGAGLQASAFANGVVVDNSAPTVALTSPSLGTMAGTFNLDATAGDIHSGIAQVEFLIDGAVVATDAVAPYSVVFDSTVSPFTPTDGTYNFQARATNGSGLVSTSPPFNVIIDNTAPGVVFVQPLTGPRTGVIRMEANATENVSDLALVEWLVDGNPLSPPGAVPIPGVQLSANLFYDYDSLAAALPDGLHTFQARVTNAAGLSTTDPGAPASILVDNSAPSVVLTTPVVGPVEGLMPFQATASDTETGITQVEFLVDGAVVFTDTVGPAPNFGFVYDLRLQPNGNHNFQARATNGVGLTSTTAVTSILVDNPGPPDLTLGGDGEGGQGSDILSDDSVPADGVSTTIKIVTIRDAAGKPIFDLTPAFTSSRPGDVIVVLQGITDTLGRAIYQVTTTQPGVATYRAFLNGSPLQDVAQTTWTNVPPNVVVTSNPLSPVNPGAIQLDASGTTDVNGDVLTFAWTQLAGPPVTPLNSGQAIATVLLTQAGAYSFQVSVSDGFNPPVLVALPITVNDVAPVANAGPDFTVQIGSPANLDGSASSDGNGDPLTFAWTEDGANPAGGTLSSLVVVQPTLTYGTVGVYHYTLVVNDGSQNSAPDDIYVTVQSPGNLIPIADAGPDQILAANSTVQLDGGASIDPDGTITSWTWTEDAGNPQLAVLSSTSIPNPTFLPTIPGVYRFRLVVQDNSGNNSAPDEVVITINAPGNGPPLACITVTAPPGTPQVGQTITLSGSCSGDPDGDPLTFVWDLQQPFLSPAIGSAVVLPYTAVVPGNHRFQLMVNDGTFTVSTTIDVAVVAPGNSPPLVSPSFTDDLGNSSSGGAGPSAVGAVVSMLAGATDPDLDPLTFVWSQIGGPSALLSSPVVANPSFTVSAAGVYQFEVSVSDGQAAVVRTLVVNAGAPGNSPPVAVQAVSGGTQAGSFVVLSGVGSFDPDGAALTHFWTQISGTPILLTNPNGAITQFVPPVAGVYVFEHRVFDGTFMSAPGVLSVTVAAAAGGGGFGIPPGVIVEGAGSGGGGGGCEALPGRGDPAAAWLLLWMLLGLLGRRGRGGRARGSATVRS